METAIKSKHLVLLTAFFSLIGCQSGTIPDPNNIDAKTMVRGDILLRNVGELSQMLDQRVGRGEINEEQRGRILEREVKKMVAKVDPTKVTNREAWQFGDVYRLGGQWETALELYKRAVDSAKTNDRKVNDSLRLARAQAHLGKVDDAIRTCRSVFNVDPKDKAPILMAVLYEVVPEAAGKGKDLELARLLEDSIKQHKETLVNVTEEGGRAFLRARPVHVHTAWMRVAQFYQGLKMDKEAREAVVKDEADRQRSGAF